MILIVVIFEGTYCDDKSDILLTFRYKINSELIITKHRDKYEHHSTFERINLKT